MALQALSLWLMLIMSGYGWWLGASIMLGIGTAMVYPALLAVVSDAAALAWRCIASAVI